MKKKKTQEQIKNYDCSDNSVRAKSYNITIVSHRREILGDFQCVLSLTQKIDEHLVIPMMFCNRPLDDIRNVTLTKKANKTTFFGEGGEMDSRLPERNWWNVN